MKGLFNNKAKVVLSLGLFSVFGLIIASCTGPQGPAGLQGPVGPKGAANPGTVATLMVPTQVTKATKTITVYGSGFTPNETVIIKLIGKWKEEGVELVDPPLGSGKANQYGAVKIAFDFSAPITTFKIGPGVFTLLAEQGAIAVSAPLEITPEEKK